MPDFTEHKDDKLIVHADELCASCLNAGNCELKTALVGLQIATTDSIHVISCARYDADKSSVYYHDTSYVDEALANYEEFANAVVELFGEFDRILSKKAE